MQKNVGKTHKDELVPTVEKRLVNRARKSNKLFTEQRGTNRQKGYVGRQDQRTTLLVEKKTSYPQKTGSMKTRKIKAVAFDMDGLMLNTEDLYGQVGEILMQRRDKTYREVVRNEMIGLPAEQAFGVLIQEEGLNESWQELQKEAEEIFETILPTQLSAMQGLSELMDFLDLRGLPRCVATSSTRTFATKALSLVGMLERVDFVMTAEDVERGKPHPDIYLASARKLSVPVENMLVLEDSPKGTTAGVTAGAYVVSVPNQHTRKGPFEGSQWIAETLKDRRIFDLIG